MLQEPFQKRTLALAMIAAALLLVLQFYSLFSGSVNRIISMQKNNAGGGTTGGGDASLVLDEGNGAPRQFMGPTIAGMTVWQALLQSAEAGSLRMKYQVQNKNLLISSVNGVGEPRGVWTVYHNGRLIDSSKILWESVAPGDTIKVVFEKK